MAVRDKVFVDLITETKQSVAGLKSFAVGIAGALAGAMALKKGLDMAIDAAKYGSELRQLRRAFKNMASSVGEDSRSVIKSLSAMAGGTISELELMRSASKAALLGLPVDQLDDLMKIARASATATGADVQTMFNDIVTGVARASPLILDNLGIVIKIGKANEEYAKSLGKTAKELTAKEKQMATLNATLKAGKVIIEKVGEAGENLTDVERWQQLSAAAADFKGELGLILMEGFRPLLTAANDWMRGMAEGFKQTREMAVELTTLQEKVRKQGKEALTLKEKISLKEAEIFEHIKMSGHAALLNSLIEQERLDKLPKLLQWMIHEKKQLKENLATSQKQMDIWLAMEAAKKAGAAETKVLTDSQKKMNEVLAETLTAWKAIDEKATLALEDIDVEGEKAAAALSGINELLMSGLGFSSTSPAILALKEMHDAMADVSDETERLAGAMGDTGQALENAMFGVEAGWAGIGEAIKEAKIETDDMKTASEELAETIGTLLVDNYLLAAEAWGTMVDQQIDGMELMGKMFKDMIVTMIKALAEMLAVEAIAAFARLNIVQGVGLLAAAGAVNAAAGAVSTMHEGGVTKKEGMVLLDKDEIVAPLSKVGSMGGIGTTVHNHYHIRGSMLAEEKTIRRISRRQALKTRNY